MDQAKIDEFNNNDLSFKRTTFDPNANGFGLSKNHGYLKVSDNNILSLANNTKYDSLYPLISETAIDYRDLNIFQSAWDPGFWRKFVTSQNYSPVAGTREMKEVKNYFGTKIMRTPNTVRIETFTTFGPVSGPEITTESIREEIFWYQKNGKVYVSMENKLLFNSGSWAVGPEGKKAVIEVGKVLGDNPDISVLIEGHTDDDAFTASGPITDNWDLSTKRATSIVGILSENKKINKQNLTAAGRGEFSPLASNETADGKAKNRRIEIILTPRLDAIAEMLNEIN